MKAIMVRHLRPGNVLGRPLVDNNGTVLLKARVLLTTNYIRALRTKGFEQVYIQDPDAEEVEVLPDEDVDPLVRARAIQDLRNTFESMAAEVASEKEKGFEAVSEACASDTMKQKIGKGHSLENLQKSVTAIMDEVLTHSTLAGLTSLKAAGTAEYNHAIDVCIIALMIGKAIGQSNIRLSQLATGCLLHDVGKTFLDNGLDHKTLICQHTKLGYDLLKNLDEYEILAPRVALEHHEHQDGSGLPRRLVGGNTISRNRSTNLPIPTLLGEIAAVANTYDNLQNGTGGRPPLTPDMALQAVRNVAGTHLNKELVRELTHLAPAYPAGSEVIITGKRYRNYSAIVAKVHPSRLDRPCIVIFRDNHNKRMDPIQIDMREDEDITVRMKS